MLARLGMAGGFAPHVAAHEPAPHMAAARPGHTVPGILAALILEPERW